MSNIQLNKQHQDTGEVNHSTPYVHDFFAFNTKPKKQSLWNKIVNFKINVAGVEHNPIAIKYGLLLPFMMELFRHVPYSYNLGYMLALYFSVKSGLALGEYINNQDHANPITVTQNGLKVIDWTLMAIFTSTISVMMK